MPKGIYDYYNFYCTYYTRIIVFIHNWLYKKSIIESIK
nr:MAG TPA: hypothetical protein [Siphoviridae sp. ctEup56]